MTQTTQKNFSFPTVVEPRIRVISQRPYNFVSSVKNVSMLLGLVLRCENEWKELVTAGVNKLGI